MVRSPVRSMRTGTACSGSVIRMTSALQGPTWVVCPMSPLSSSTVCPLKTPLAAPRSMSRQCRGETAQLAVLARHRLVAHGAQLKIALRSAQPRVLRLQHLARLQAFAEPAPRGRRGVYRQLDRVGGRLQHVAQLFQVVLALVEVHDDDRQQRVEREAESCGAAPPQRSAGSCPERCHLRLARSSRYSRPKCPGPNSSISSRMRPPPRATQVSGSSATTTGSPVSLVSSLS